MSARSIRRSVALGLAAVAVLAGAATVAATATVPPQHTAADSTWGGVAPSDPSPSPTAAPSSTESFTLRDSTWGG
ncbi:hypothetical protein [Streptomyces sp. CB03911]|uniref:hypothetical protein n=1 Tax=Streptomyces sp. CB03911 TaxID=1804758 RepID=UPI0018FEEA1E|nr:hypothetical protein [Streptomyces sp. CB03911]